MTKISYSGYRFPPEIIHQAIWLYLRFTLSFRDVEDLLAARGIAISYETVRRWVNHFGPIIAAELRKRRPRPHTTWHLDEVYLKIDGRMVYLWRAVDAEGEVLDVLDATSGARPMRANARAILIEALGNAYRWLVELQSDPRQTLETLGLREGKSERSIRMTVSLAFLAPDIVEAAVEGRLPRGYGLKRLIDLPLAWPDQWRTLGLEAPAQT
jgi:hypothetical protein